MTLPAAAIWTRYLGALALLAVGADHLEQDVVEHYSAIPTIGPLFVLNFATAVLLAGGMLLPVERLRGRAGDIALRALCAGGIGVAAGSLAGLLISESDGLFGFMETGYRAAIVLAMGLEGVAIVLLGAHLVVTRRPARARAGTGREPSPTGRPHVPH
jgi:hypothetical protein